MHTTINASKAAEAVYLLNANPPALVGLSRKSTVYKTLNIMPEESLNGTTVMHTLALENGAQILRVHDVKEAVETIRLWTSYTFA